MALNVNEDNECGIGTSSSAFYGGSPDSSNAPFRVTYDGHLYSTNATISGDITASSGTIGGCTIEEGVLKVDTINIRTGAVTANEIASHTITSDEIDTDRLYCNAANVKGTLTASQIDCQGVIDAGTINADNITTGTLSVERLSGPKHTKAIEWYSYFIPGFTQKTIQVNEKQADGTYLFHDVIIDVIQSNTQHYFLAAVPDTGN